MWFVIQSLFFSNPPWHTVILRHSCYLPKPPHYISRMSVSSFVTLKCWKSHRSPNVSFPVVDRSIWKFASLVEVTNANFLLILVECLFFLSSKNLWKKKRFNWFNNLLSGLREASHSLWFPQHLRGCISWPIFINQMGLNSASGSAALSLVFHWLVYDQ